MAETMPVVAGQVWRDRDSRNGGRHLRVVCLSRGWTPADENATDAICEVVFSVLRGVWLLSPYSRRTKIRLARLCPPNFELVAQP